MTKLSERQSLVTECSFPVMESSTSSVDASPAEDEPAWLAAASPAAMPSVTPVASFADSTADDMAVLRVSASSEPEWLSQGIVSPTSPEPLSIAGSPPYIASRTPSHMRPADEEAEPEWLSHAVLVQRDSAVGVDAPGVQASAAFHSAMDASRRALGELTSLSSTDLSDGLLAMSVDYTGSMRTRLAAGAEASATALREVLGAISSPPDGETRLAAVRASAAGHWRGVAQLPMGLLVAMVALLHAILAIGVHFAANTPRALRELTQWASTTRMGGRVRNLLLAKSGSDDNAAAPAEAPARADEAV